jgi:hypothetical protein
MKKNIVTVFGTVVVTMITAFSGLAQTPIIVADNVLNPAPVWYEHQKHVARTRAGTLIAIWQDKGTNGQIVFSTYDEAFQSWAPAAPISNAGDQAQKPSLAVDVEGFAFCAWQQRESSSEKWRIYFSRYSAGAWSTPVKASQSDALDSEECNIEYLSNGRLAIVYNTDNEADGAEWILCTFSNNFGDTWSTPDTLSSSDGIINGTSVTNGRVSLYAGSNGRLAAAWHENVAAPREREIYFNQYDGSKWQGEVIISDVTAVVTRHWYPAVVVDGADNIYVIYADDSNTAGAPRHVLVRKKAWDQPWDAAPDTIYTSTTSDFDVDRTAAIDANGVLYAGFSRFAAAQHDEAVYAASTDGGATWSEPVVLNRPGHDANYITFCPRVYGDGVDATWREFYRPNTTTGDTTNVMYAKLPLFTTGVKDRPSASSVPQQFSLSQNHPNPFNPATTIAFSVPARTRVKLAVYDLMGHRVATLIDREMAPAQHQVIWDGRNSRGQVAPSGVYFYRLETSSLTLTRKMILIR